ncbi:MAG TPA: phage minor capsid protein, partial [Bryobacteraceae bacterium]|nr:phage minor capsid protein [Bryobacteraceae bacterium]
AEHKAAEIAALREWLQGQLPGLLADVPGEVRAAVEAAYDAGGKEAGRELIQAALPDPEPQAYARGASVRAIAKEAVGNLRATRPRILRSALDAYREVIVAGAEDVVTGVATRQQSVQRALNQFADRGVPGFVDKAGRGWDLGSYAEMATRSAVIRSSVAGKLEKFEAAGQDLVVVSDHWEECDLCRSWEGKVLSRSGRTPGYPTVADAEAGGLFHPNCRHTVDLWTPGLSEPVKRQGPLEKAEAERVYRERLTQRRLERGIRQWKRREMAALDPVEQAKASRKVLEWQKGLEAHIGAVNERRAGLGIPAMKRQPGRERVIWAPDARRTAREAAGFRRSKVN